jgi:hypothetical protein
LKIRINQKKHLRFIHLVFLDPRLDFLNKNAFKKIFKAKFLLFINKLILNTGIYVKNNNAELLDI